MSDKELLELAAKAAGKKTRIYEGEFQVETEYPEVYCFWNPLLDDGDALRLAVKLNCMPEVDYEMGYVTIVLTLSNGVQELINDDPYAATRRAIVRAAAEIGRAME